MFFSKKAFSGKFFVGDCGSELKGQIEGHIFSSLKPNNRNSTAYFGSHNSRLYRLHFENHQVQIVNIIQLESEISSTPFVYEFCDLTFVICACNTGVVYVVNGLTNSIILRKQLPDASFSSPYVFDKKIYIGCRDNNLYCIDIGSVLLNNVSWNNLEVWFLLAHCNDAHFLDELVVKEKLHYDYLKKVFTFIKCRL